MTIVDRIVDAITRHEVWPETDPDGRTHWHVLVTRPDGSTLVRFRSAEFEHAKARCDRCNALAALAVMRAQRKTVRARAQQRRWCNATAKP